MKKDDLIKSVKTKIKTPNKIKKSDVLSVQTVKNLTAKHYRLLDLYFSGMSATESAIEVGYAVSSAHNLARRVIESVEGIRYLDELSHKHQQRTFFTIEKVENELMSLYEEMTLDDEKNYKERMALLKLVMDYKGMFISQNVTNNNTQININLIEHKPTATDYVADPRLTINIDEDTE